MNKINLDDTIVAISTPIGEGGIGIVRLSGKDALKITDKIFQAKKRKKLTSFKTYTVHYGHVVEGNHPPEADVRRSFNEGGRKVVDEVIVTVMRAPRTYTKEDVVEINCHSGIVPLKKILDLVMLHGARLAEPGEFTRRAFLNGRIDILQAEAVLDIIRAKTDLSLTRALNNLEGSLSKKINDKRDKLMDIFAHIEASIDFSEEDDMDIVKKNDILGKLKEIKRDIERLISSAHEGKVLRHGIKTVICGSPNVGKSSLMNALLQESRAIVTHLAGTTRDTIEEIVNIKGIPVILMDTAGISQTDHPIEKEGVKRSHFSIKTADLVLFVVDYGRRLNRNDREIIHNIKQKQVIIVINKQDLKRGLDVSAVKKFFPKSPSVYVSAINSSGIDELEERIEDIVFKGKVPAPDAGLSNDRQVGVLRRSVEDIEEAIASFRKKVSLDCVAIYLRSAIETLGEITGDTITEEALDRIFAEFCIGK